LLVVGCWLLVVGCWLLVVGCWLFRSSGAYENDAVMFYKGCTPKDVVRFLPFILSVNLT